MTKACPLLAFAGTDIRRPDRVVVIGPTLVALESDSDWRTHIDPLTLGQVRPDLT